MLRKRKSWWRQVSNVLLETTMSLRRTNRGTDACILFFVQGRHPSVFLHLPAVPLQHQHKQVLWWAGPARSIHSSQHHSDHPYGCGGLGVPCHLHLWSQCTWPCWLVCLCAVQSFTFDIQAMHLRQFCVIVCQLVDSLDLSGGSVKLLLYACISVACLH